MQSLNSWCLVAVFLAHVFATQVPFHSRYAKSQPLTDDGEYLEDWNLNTAPNPNSTDNLVFETVHSLLLRWPNTRMRNGHAIVPGTIPEGTLLYHGRFCDELPTSSEWFATDPEHSYAFCVNHPEEDCWLFTLMTTRALKIVYFDGSSAAKLPGGTLDTQDLLIWGEPRGGEDEEELERIRDICEWGKDFGVDAFVRMQMDFEVMLCDVTSGVRVVSSSNVVFRCTDGPKSLYFNMSVMMAMFEVMNSGSWHDRFPGEARVKLDLTRLVTFYDTQLVPSLVPIRAGQQRWDHRIQNISKVDLSATKSRLEEFLSKPDDRGPSSGIDWAALIHVIANRYAGRLELTRYLLNAPTAEEKEVLDLAVKAQMQLRIMLTPYILDSVAPPHPDSLEEGNLDWAMSVFNLCATTHTHGMDSLSTLMTTSEKLLLQAVRGTTREVCRVVTKMWATGVRAGLDPLLNLNAKDWEGERQDGPKMADVKQVRRTWSEELDQLMVWLDWNEWIGCDPACGPEDICYLPTWPIGFPGQMQVPRGADPSHITSSDSFGPLARSKLAANPYMHGSLYPDPGEWIRPEPKCIRRVAPYTF